MTTTRQLRARRWLLAWVVLAGIAAMHVLPMGAAGPVADGMSTAAAAHDHPTPAGGEHPTSHADGHPCLAVLGVVLALVVAVGVLLHGRHELTLPRAVAVLARRAGRDPPWTVLTQAELSVLRV